MTVVNEGAADIADLIKTNYQVVGFTETVGFETTADQVVGYYTSED